MTLTILAAQAVMIFGSVVIGYMVARAGVRRGWSDEHGIIIALILAIVWVGAGAVALVLFIGL